MRKIAVLWFGFILSASSLFAAPSVVTVSGRKILVNGQPFTIQGVNYSPIPVGYTGGAPGGGCLAYSWWNSRESYIADFPLIKRMGANTIRTYNIMNNVADSAQVLAALDAAQAQGLYVIMAYYPPHFVDASDPSFASTIRTNFIAAVQAYKDHPAVLMWALGNEQNLDNGAWQGWYPLVNEVAGRAKAIDPNHPVTTVEGEYADGTKTYNIGRVTRMADDPNMGNLDLWGFTAYRGKTFQGLFETLVSSTSKPLLVAEFGKDAYRDATRQEDQAMQVSYIDPQWREIAANLSASVAGKPLIGATVFEWTDEWWQDTGPGTSCFTHDTMVAFTHPEDPDDPNYNNEWFGLAAISPIDPLTNPAGTNRSLRKSYYTLQGFWNPSAGTPGSGGSNSLFDGPVRNFPNPFRSGGQSTKFVAFFNEAGAIDISIYDAGGQFVISLPKGTSAGPGRVEMLWDGRNNQGAYVSPGLYHARIEGKGSAHEDTQFRRVVAVK